MPNQTFVLAAVVHMLTGLIAGICAVSGYLITGAIIYAIGGYLVHQLGIAYGAYAMRAYLQEEFDKAFNEGGEQM